MADFKPVYVADMRGAQPVSGNFLREIAFPRFETSLDYAAQWTTHGRGTKPAPAVRLGEQAGKVANLDGVLHTEPFFQYFASMPSSERDLANAMAKYGSENTDAVIADLQTRAIRILNESIDEAEEYAIATALTEGAAKALGADGSVLQSVKIWGDEEADRPVISLVKLWSNETADPIGDILAMQAEQVAHGGAPATTLILGSLAGQLFIGNPQVREMIKAFQIGQVAPEGFQYKGARYLGWIAGVDVYVSGQQINIEGTPTPIIPSGAAILTGRNAGNVMAYGGVRIKDGDSLPLVEGRRHLYSETGGNPPAIAHYMRSASLPIVHNVWDNVVAFVAE